MSAPSEESPEPDAEAGSDRSGLRAAAESARPSGAGSSQADEPAPAPPVHPSLERYRPLIEDAEDWKAFAAALARPLPATVWANTLRDGAARVGTLLAAEGHRPEPIGWCPGAFRLGCREAGGSPSRSGSRPTPGRGILAQTGLYHVQEEVSLLPVALLDPRPGERVLDLCAAPGGKTARIAVAMANRGTVVANDVDWRRLIAVGRNLDRLGLVNVATTAWDAANFPEGGGLYDRVLADVPCTCEGTSRKSSGVLSWGGEEERQKTAAVQTAILRKAVRLCRAGGRIVYSTCTYAPEENEAVVDAVLREVRAAEGPDALQIAEARLDGFPADPGLTAWQGASFDPSLAGCLRVWPHRHDTGGFFVAVLERGGEPRSAGSSVPSELESPAGSPAGGAARTGSAGVLHAFEEVDRERWLDPVIERFGFPAETFDGLRLVRHGAKTLAVVARDLAPPAHPAPQSFGLSFLHAGMRHPKLTTPAAMAFGAAARRNVLDLSAEDRGRAGVYLARGDLDLSAADAATLTGPGYVLVRWAGATLGVGWFRPAAGGGGSVRSLFPKRWL